MVKNYLIEYPFGNKTQSGRKRQRILFFFKKKYLEQKNTEKINGAKNFAALFEHELAKTRTVNRWRSIKKY